MIFTGTWTFIGIDVLRAYGIDVRTTTATSTVKYTFFGTGFDMRFSSAAGMNVTVDIDGSTNLSGFATSSYSGGTMTFTASTGVISGEALSAGAVVSGLTLGLHTVTITQNNTNAFLLGGFDIITPIHSAHTTFGNLSMKDIRNFDSMKDVNKTVQLKTWFLDFDRTNAVIRKSKNISQILGAGTSVSYIYLEEPTADGMHVVSTSNQTESIVSNLVGNNNHQVNFITRNSAGTDTTGTINNITISGKLQKDELEE